MLPVTDLSPQIEKLHKSYLEKKSGNIQALDASRTKEDFDLLKRFYESSAIKAGLVNILRYTHQLISFEEQLSQREKDELSTLTDNIENAVFRVGVFGSFSSGKSTLINHLLGNTNLLPVDEDRCTAAYTLIQRADDKNPSGTVRIEWKAVAILLQDLQDCAQSMGLGLENLPAMTDEIKLLDWVKQNDSQFKKIEEELDKRDDWDLTDDLNRKKQVALALLKGLPQYRQLQHKYKILDGRKLKTLMQDEPAVTLVQCLQFYHDHPLLRHVQIIDSPGSGSVNLRDEFLAHSLVKHSHALLFLTEAIAPISKHDETNLLAVIGKNATGGQINSLFVLANKTDLSDNNNNPERIVHKITKRMEKYFKGRCQARKIYPISCKTGLNLEQFTADLNHFLQADKDAFFLENTSKNVERFIEKLLQNLNNQLKKHDESLQDITDKIKVFQKDKEENQESIAIHLKNYELIYYKSKLDDEYNIVKTLNETFDAGLPNFEVALQHNFENASSDNKKDIIKNMIEQFIKDVVQKSTLIIAIEIQKEFQKIQSELARKHRVLENVSVSFTIGSRYDALKNTGWFSLASMLLYGIFSVVLIPVLPSLLSCVYKAKNNIPNLVAYNLKDSFKNTWQDDKKNQQNPLSVSIKNAFDSKLQEDIKNIGKAHMEIFNQLLKSIEEKLQAQYNEKQKSETERQMLQRNRGLISEELKFLKNEQACLQNQLQKLYVNHAVN